MLMYFIGILCDKQKEVPDPDHWLELLTSATGIKLPKMNMDMEKLKSDIFV